MHKHQKKNHKLEVFSKISIHRNLIRRAPKKYKRKARKYLYIKRFYLRQYKKWRIKC